MRYTNTQTTKGCSKSHNITPDTHCKAASPSLNHPLMVHSTPIPLPRPEVLQYLRNFARTYRPEQPRAPWPPVSGSC